MTKIPASTALILVCGPGKLPGRIEHRGRRECLAALAALTGHCGQREGGHQGETNARFGGGSSAKRGRRPITGLSAIARLRNFLRCRSRMCQHVPAATRRFHHMRRTAIALACRSRTGSNADRTRVASRSATQASRKSWTVRLPTTLHALRHLCHAIDPDQGGEYRAPHTHYQPSVLCNPGVSNVTVFQMSIPANGNGTTAPDGAERTYNIAAVDRALDLLEALARIGPATLAALAEDAGMTRTAGFRLLRTMQARGFAIQDRARGLWRLGARWGVLSRAAASQGALGATAAPVLAALAAETGENTYLVVRTGLEGEVLALHRADPSLRVYVEAGKRFLLHAGPGRLLLAYAPDTIQTQALSKRLPRLTPATRIDPAWIAADLERIRSRGWLLTSDEMFAGACAISAPVRDAGGDVVAAIVIAAPTLRMRPPRPRSLLAPVIAAATQMSEALGAPGSAHAAQPAKPVRRVHHLRAGAAAETNGASNGHAGAETRSAAD